MSTQYGCVLLAGGAGSRMGHINKANLEFADTTFAEIITGELSRTELPCYLSAANYEQTVPAGWHLVRDEVTDQETGYIGPMGGIYSCLRQAECDGLGGLFFAPCDAPFYRKEIIEKLYPAITEDCDAAVWRTTDGRVQTAFGWYSVRCLKAFREDIDRCRFKLLRTLDKVRLTVMDVSSAGLEDSMFMNINSMDDYAIVGSKRHLIISGKKRAGKTTLVNRVIRESRMPVYGYQTLRMPEDETGKAEVYMYPAGNVDFRRGSDNYIGSTARGIRDVNNGAFNSLGVSVIKSADRGGIIIMDEVGFMERGADTFCKAVEDAFDGDIPVLATIKDTDHDCAYISRIRNHPDAEVITIREDNREEVYRSVKAKAALWELESRLKKGAYDEQY